MPDMHAFAHNLLREHDVYPQPVSNDRLGLALLTGSLIAATVWLGPHELILISWAWLGGWSTLRVWTARRQRDRQPLGEDQST
jgi:hypothetical protein